MESHVSVDTSPVIDIAVVYAFTSLKVAITRIRIAGANRLDLL